MFGMKTGPFSGEKFRTHFLVKKSGPMLWCNIIEKMHFLFLGALSGGYPLIPIRKGGVAHTPHVYPRCGVYSINVSFQ